jgi:hypothetical protein
LWAEGAGGLLLLLRGKGWGTSLSAGVADGGFAKSSAGYMFHVAVQLTTSGLQHVNLMIINSPELSKDLSNFSVIFAPLYRKKSFSCSCILWFSILGSKNKQHPSAMHQVPTVMD